jgi:putative toxin-antitoxin system antitoxin component (TIGR02293 family)
MQIEALESLFNATALKQVERLNAGLRASVFSSLAAAMDVPTRTLAVTLGLSDRTIRSRIKATPGARLKKTYMKGYPAKRLKRIGRDYAPGLLSPVETEVTFRTYRVLRRAQEVLQNDKAAASWLTTPQKALGERTPLSMLSRDVGANEVMNVLAAIQHGVYL